MFDLSPRWRKLVQDLRNDRGRALLMIAAIAVSLMAIGSVLGAYAILTREIAVNYLGTRPASATLDLEGGVDPALVEEVKQLPQVAEAEAREVVLARVQVGDDWKAMLLFVVDDFTHLRLNTFRSESGAWPPPDGTMLLERQAVQVVKAGPGQKLWVKTPNGAPHEVPVTGLVHDPGLAPAWQEQEGYGYITRASLAQLGEEPVLHELRILTRDRPSDMKAIEATAADLGKWLGEHGHTVHQIRVPPPMQHPHQSQMTTILFLLLVFSVMALVLSGVLVATSLAAMLARQVREIGVMKTVGARAGQIGGIYMVLVAALGLASFLLALPVGIAGARGFSRAVAEMLNFTLTRSTLPGWVFAVQAASAVVVPLILAALPIRRASRITVREAIDQHGVSGDRLRSRFSALPTPLRNALRRPARLALTLGLLAAGGAMFMTALNVSRSWELNISKIYMTRHYDVELRLRQPQDAILADELRQVPGVKVVEQWGYSPAAFATPGQIDRVRTYPDRGHGSLSVLAPPPGTKLVGFPVKAGRWLRPDDTDALVLNHGAAAQAGGPQVGSQVMLSIDGVHTTWRLVGIVEEVGSPGAAYVTDQAFAQAMGTPGKARMLRIVTEAGSPQARSEIIRSIERKLTGMGVGIEAAIPLAILRTAIGDHVGILISALIAMAVVMAVVGMLGLGSTMGVSVIERTREFAVMKTIGATPGRITRMIVIEALFIGGLSFVLAFALSVPLTTLVDWLIGNLGFLAPLPLAFVPTAALLWLALTCLVSPLATLLPARRAATLTVREALMQA